MHDSPHEYMGIGSYKQMRVCITVYQLLSI